MNNTNTGNNIWPDRFRLYEGLFDSRSISGGCISGGDIIWIDELNDPSVAINLSNEGQTRATKVSRRRVEVGLFNAGCLSSVSGNTITVTDLLTSLNQASLSPRAIILSH